MAEQRRSRLAALQDGVHPKDVSERLGHASIAITLDTSSHVMAGMHVEAAERINAGLRRALAKWIGVSIASR